ncbi:hypothetical protein F5Y08DRAFT_89235 [Xylaria arbuscula]|nr:hypothetical protein F5Y08DRAFT_89235 [Xylaria arbuscula]
MSNQTCDPYDNPFWDFLNSVPKNITVGGVIRTNDSLSAMQKCCTPNPVRTATENDCALWCEIPENITKFEDWKDCLFDNDKGLSSADWRNAQSMGVAIHPSVLGFAVTALVFAGLFTC